MAGFPKGKGPEAAGEEQGDFETCIILGSHSGEETLSDGGKGSPIYPRPRDMKFSHPFPVMGRDGLENGRKDKVCNRSDGLFQNERGSRKIFG
jgi:hypothetical protein